MQKNGETFTLGVGNSPEYTMSDTKDEIGVENVTGISLRYDVVYLLQSQRSRSVQQKEDQKHVG